MGREDVPGTLTGPPPIRCHLRQGQPAGQEGDKASAPVPWILPQLSVPQAFLSRAVRSFDTPILSSACCSSPRTSADPLWDRRASVRLGSSHRQRKLRGEEQALTSSRLGFRRNLLPLLCAPSSGFASLKKAANITHL